MTQAAAHRRSQSSSTQARDSALGSGASVAGANQNGGNRTLSIAISSIECKHYFAGTWFFTEDGYNPNGANSCGYGPASSQPGNHYTNWAAREPGAFNYESGGIDPCRKMASWAAIDNGQRGKWVDFSYFCEGTVNGYVVEYGGMLGDPPLPLQGRSQYA